MSKARQTLLAYYRRRVRDVKQAIRDTRRNDSF